MGPNIRKHISDEKGVTLIDLSIALVVISLIALPLVKSMDREMIHDRVQNSTNDMTAIRTAIHDFYFANNRYPCPAAPDLTEADAEYGKEDEDCIAGTDDGDGNGAVFADVRDLGGGLLADEQAVIGAVPFKTLSLEEAVSFDAWNRKYTYAVPLELTDDAQFDPTRGLIELSRYESTQGEGLNRQCTTNIQNDFETEAHFVLVSHGTNGLGAYGTDGTIARQCDEPGASTSARETENCDNDGDFFLHDCAVSMANGSDYYDDITTTQDALPTRLWFSSAANPDGAISNAGNFRINTATPPLDVNLDVGGNILADNGNVKSSQICDSDGNNCFSPSVIGGAGMHCPGGNAVNGIANGSADCQLYYQMATPDTCPAGQLVSGLDASGDIICTTP